MGEEGTYRILLDDEWTLEDLYQFSHTYEQVYFFFDAIGQELTDVAHERIIRAFEAFPWRGGYSAVNFYNQLSYTVARRRRLRIVAIKKTSPGFLDLALILVTAPGFRSEVQRG
jgi:hypothetical protein